MGISKIYKVKITKPYSCENIDRITNKNILEE